MFKITIQTHFNIERFMSKNIRNMFIMVKPEYWEGGGIAVGVHQGGEQEGQKEHHLLQFIQLKLFETTNSYKAIEVVYIFTSIKPPNKQVLLTIWFNQSECES